MKTYKRNVLLLEPNFRLRGDKVPEYAGCIISKASWTNVRKTLGDYEIYEIQD